MKQEIKERIELINKGIVPAGYKKTPVGICPVEWEENTLKNIFIFKNGLNKEKSAFGKGTPIINYTDVWGKRGLKLKDVKGKVTLNKNEIENYSAKKGDVFFTRTSETINEIGLTSVLLEDIKDCVFSGFVLRGRPISNLIVNEYNQYCYSLDFMRNEITKKSSYTTRALTNGELLSQVLINLPTKSEQQKIAEILDCATRQVELQEQLVDKLKVQKKAFMQKLLTPQPDWQKDKLEKLINEGLITLYRGKVISKEDIKKFPGNYPIYSSSVINNGKMGEYGKYMFDEELITWSIDGGGNFFYRNKHKFSVTNVCGYIKINTNYFNYKFLAEELIYLHSKFSFDYMLKAHPSVIKKIYAINYPNLEEQTKIAKLALNLDKQIELQQKLLEQYKLRQKALMQLLLTGIVRVN